MGSNSIPLGSAKGTPLESVRFTQQDGGQWEWKEKIGTKDIE